jgi:hypothetical protein
MLGDSGPLTHLSCLPSLIVQVNYGVNTVLLGG